MRALTDGEIAAKFWSHVDKTGDCWRWTLSLNHGYGQIWFNGKRWIAPRLAWVLTHGPINDSRQAVCHTCDNPTCVRPQHLFLADQLTNLADMRLKGRGTKPPTRRGANNNKVKLTEADVLRIRHIYPTGEHSLRTLALEYGVEKQTIASILHRRIWKYL